MTDRLTHRTTEQRRAEAECLDTGKINDTPCFICGGRINYELRPRHHRTAVAHNIDPDPDHIDLTPAHKQCAEPQQPSSRRW